MTYAISNHNDDKTNILQPLNQDKWSNVVFVREFPCLHSE